MNSVWWGVEERKGEMMKREEGQREERVGKERGAMADVIRRAKAKGYVHEWPVRGESPEWDWLGLRKEIRKFYVVVPISGLRSERTIVNGHLRGLGDTHFVQSWSVPQVSTPEEAGALKTT